MNENPYFIHLTDLHIGNPDIHDPHLYSDTNTTLKLVLDQLKGLLTPPRFILVSGDLTNRGDIISYKHLQRLFADAELNVPVFFALGNHDNRENFYKTIMGRTDNITAPYYYDIIIDDIHLIVLDSSEPRKIGGSIEAEQFSWLEKTLALHENLPKLIMSHHAPALDEDRPDLEWESLSCKDTAILRQMLAPYNVLGIMCGHVHYDRISFWNKIPIIVGIGQHTALDPLYLDKGLRTVTGASYSICTLRPSGLTVSCVPFSSQRIEISKISHAEREELFQKYETENLLAN